MTYLFCYDFPSSPGGDRRRSRLAKHLEGLGLRVQYSVFEVQLPPEKLPRILDIMRGIIDQDADSLRVYALCAACLEKSFRLGSEATCEHTDLLIW